MVNSAEASQFVRPVNDKTQTDDKGTLNHYRVGDPSRGTTNAGDPVGAAKQMHDFAAKDHATQTKDLPKGNDDFVAQAIGQSILANGRLDMTSPTGRALFVEMYSNYKESGQAGMQAFLDKVNKELGGDFKLSMREDPELLKQIQEDDKNKGKTSPDFLRWIDLKDDKGRDRGNILFIHSPQADKPAGTPI